MSGRICFGRSPGARHVEAGVVLGQCIACQVLVEVLRVSWFPVRQSRTVKQVRTALGPQLAVQRVQSAAGASVHYASIFFVTTYCNNEVHGLHIRSIYKVVTAAWPSTW